MLASLHRQTEYLGSGHFGTVYKGIWKRSSNGSGISVAIKMLKNGTESDKLKFLQEGAVNGQFHHPNVVKLYGMVTIGEPVSEI
jgi:ephrin-B